MKHAFIRKLTAGLAVLTLTFGMSISAMAAEAPTDLTEMTFKVTFENKTTGAEMNEGNAFGLPQTKFYYTIESGTAAAATDTTPEILAGPADGAKFGTNEDRTDAWNTVNAAETEDEIKVTFDKTKFSKAGIYRYVIKQTALGEEQTALGITADEHDTRYLDVYVVQDEEGIRIASAIMTKDDTPTFTHTAGSDNDSLKYDTKDDGYENTIETYSLTLIKKIEGSMADPNQEFPFEVALSYEEGADDSTTVNGLKVYVGTAADNDKGESSNGTTTGLTENYTVGSTIMGIQLKGGESIVISGLTKEVAAKITEKIDASLGYYISSEVNNFAAGSTKTVSDVQTDTGTEGRMKDSNASVTYTNTKDAISPTGVVLRTAPYVMMIGFAAFFILAARRRREDEDLA